MCPIHAVFIFDRFEYIISYPRLIKLLLFTLGYLFPWCMFINKWLRVPFGRCSAPEEFQRHLNEIFEGLEGVTAIADDLLVTGNTHEEALADHDRNLTALLQRCRERNLKLNKGKFVFKQQKLKYCGHILTSEGILPDPAN